MTNRNYQKENELLLKMVGELRDSLKLSNQYLLMFLDLTDDEIDQSHFMDASKHHQDSDRLIHDIEHELSVIGSEQPERGITFVDYARHLIDSGFNQEFVLPTWEQLVSESEKQAIDANKLREKIFTIPRRQGKTRVAIVAQKLEILKLHDVFFTDNIDTTSYSTLMESIKKITSKIDEKGGSLNLSSLLVSLNTKIRIIELITTNTGSKVSAIPYTTNFKLNEISIYSDAYVMDDECVVYGPKLQDIF